MIHKLRALGLLILGTLAMPSAARAQPGAADAAPPAQAAPAAREEARARFERGLALYRQKQLDAALAEFLLSRTLYPTRAASFNAARVYKELGRYDEALGLLEAMPRELQLSAGDAAEVERELREVRANVGVVVVRASEPDATVVIDGRERRLDEARAVTVSVGTHVVRVHKDGFVPFETRLEVAAQTSVTVDAKLGALTRGGRLAVLEDRGESLAVLVDGLEVGKTPWEGTVTVGSHTVALRGEQKMGSPPTPVSVKLNQLTKVSLVAEPLACSLRVEPTPRTANVAIDSVEVGRGVWDGPLRCGGHLVELAAEGFLPRSRTVTLREGSEVRLAEALERDPTSAVWQAKNPPRITAEAMASGLLSPGFGGDLGGACGEGCNAGLGVGGSLAARAGYRLGLGLGASVDAGFLYVAQQLEGRATETRPYGLPAHPGRADDALRLSGPMLGGSLSYAVGDRFPFVARLGGGVLLASFRDARAGTFTAPSGATYTLPEVAQSTALTSLYIDPELRVGYRIFRGGTLEAGIRGIVVAPLGSTPRWSQETELSLGACPSPDAQVCSGRGVYPAEDLVSSLLFFVGPTFGFRGEL